MQNTIEEKLKQLLKIQNIDMQLNDIEEIKGDLPDEAKTLASELDAMQTRLQQDQKDVASLEQAIKTQRVRIKDSNQLAQRHKEQQMNVRNNREYDALTKEIELQDLDRQLSEKKIKAYYEQIEKKKHTIDQASAAIQKKELALTDKQQKLKEVVEDSQEEERSLQQQRTELIENLDKDFLWSYENIRKKASNNLAIAVIKQGACSGCCIIVCPQICVVIDKKEELVKCEHCGRILADVISYNRPEENIIEEPQLSVEA